jgi:NADH-quinone oxidoreductase subunit G
LGRIGASLSPHLTVEEAFLLAKYVRQLDPQALLVVGPIPIEGQDETFKNGFTIRAEKCPNRRGVEEIVSHFMGRIATFEELIAAVEAGEIRGAWISGGYKHNWIDRESGERLATAECLVVQDLFESPLMERASYRLPGSAFAEREGSYVNFADRLQSVEWAVRPPVGVRIEAGVYWELLGMPGLFKARRALDELASYVPFFLPAADPVDPLGVDLKAEAPAEAAAAS